MKLVILIVVCTLATFRCMVEAGKSDEERRAASKRSGEILGDLYQTLRTIAFPKSPYSKSDTVHNRFILLIPGKALNYDDYYPGDLYTASVKAKNTSAPHVLVPPSVMEKWFDIADVVVGGDLNSGDTGKSLAQIYRNILSQIKIKDFKTLYQDAEARYNEAKKFLTESIQNPVNVSENITRMQLYSIYQEEYASQKLNLERELNNARLSKTSLEYELWFQRNFSPLNTKVENAYSKWIVFGQKELVELYKTFMDMTSAGAALEEARVSLRASGVTSLDRTRTIYPVSFEPSNWYEYLLENDRPPSRDMLIARRSLLHSELDTLRTAVRVVSESKNQQAAQRTTNALEERVNATSDERNEATEAAINARNRCMQKQANGEGEESGEDEEDPCTQFEESADRVEDTTMENAGATANYFSAAFLLKTNQQYQNYMQARMTALDREISELNTQLDNMEGDQVYLGEITESIGGLDGRGEESLNQWMKFSYNSETTHTRSTETKFGISIDVDTSVEVPNVASGTGSLNTGFEFAEMRKAFSNAKLLASGQLLRVFIKRPWFKPSLFDNPILNFIQYDYETKKAAYVSPPSSSEQELADIINGKADNIYLMPEYVTSFLLARNIRLQFSGVDTNSVNRAMQFMFSHSRGGSGTAVLEGVPVVFGGNARIGFHFGRKTMTAHRTANGMIIEIPGAQVIGYYTQVMPQFPKEQN